MLPAAGSNVKWDSESRTTDLKSIGAVGGATPPNSIPYHDRKVVYIKHIDTSVEGLDKRKMLVRNQLEYAPEYFKVQDHDILISSMMILKNTIK